MQYQFETEPRSFEDLASGRVLFNQAGMTSFPARLASEIFQRCVKHLSAAGQRGPYTIYDPCCGGGHLLAMIGFLHGERIERIVASDIDGRALSLAERNIALLNQPAMQRRTEQLEALVREFGKDSHREAVESARRLRRLIAERLRDLSITCFQADALNPGAVPSGRGWSADVVITDLPYGNLVHWSDDGPGAPERLLEGVLPVLKPHAVVAVIADKEQSVKHERFSRKERFRVGKREVTLLEPKDLG